jgi:dipeptidyl aminopeptidase/acylaminoacyl peptidase
MGVILYEMITGQVPFDAETPFAVVMKHVIDPLPLPRSVKPDLPEAVERVILKALAKEPDDRFQTMRDLLAAFGQAVQTATVQPAPTPPTPIGVPEPEEDMPAEVPPPAPQGWLGARPPWLLVVTGIALLVLVAIGMTLSRISARVETNGGQVRVVLPTSTSPEEVAAAATPTTPVPATATATPTSTSTPFAPSPTPTSTSPEEVAAAATPTTPAPATTTATPTPASTPLAPSPTPTSTSPEEGKIVQSCDDQVCVHNAATGQTSQLTNDLDVGEISFFAWSPDGEQIVFSAGSAPGIADRKLYLINADGSDLRQLTFGEPDDGSPAWSPDGEWIAYMSWCDLWLIRPDGSDAHRLLGGTPDFCATAMSWSPDGQQIVFSGPQSALWVVNRDGSDSGRIYSFDQPMEWVEFTGWSPDGRQIACQYWDGSEHHAVLINADGGGEKQTLEYDEVPWSWFPNYWPQWHGEVGVAARTPNTRPTPTTLKIRAYIDGRSHLVLRGDTAHWYHLEAVAPGRLHGPNKGSTNEPTYLNGEAWYPDWPDVPDRENVGCDCDSSTFVGIPALARQDQTVSLDIIQALDKVAILQQPSAANDYTLIVEFDNLGPGGADWYTIELGYISY